MNIFCVHNFSAKSQPFMITVVLFSHITFCTIYHLLHTGITMSITAEAELLLPTLQ